MTPLAAAALAVRGLACRHGSLAQPWFPVLSLTAFLVSSVTLRSFSMPAAACLAALSFSALAHDGGLQIYGRINTSVERSTENHSSTSGVRNNESFFGFRGSEDLGGGLKAGFILESGFESDTGANTDSSFFNRKSEVYLAGDFGTLRMGRIISEAYYATADIVNAHNFDTGTSADALYAFVSNGANHLSYRAPTWNNLTVEVGTSLHEKTAEPAKNAWDLAANYARGDWSFGLGYGDWGPARQATLRATYVLNDSWTFSAYHQYSRGWDHANYVVDASQGGRHTTRLASIYTQGANEYHVNVGYAGKAGGQADTQALQWTLAYNHNFSKLTKVYALFTRIHNRDQASYGTGVQGGDLRSFGVGIRQYF
jgi:predicted porin